MNIALFGGSFNPPHLGHQIVMEQVFELIPNLDELWLLLDYQHSFAEKNSLIVPRHRLAMTRMLEKPRVTTETCAIDQKMPGNTIVHITYLKRIYPRYQFSFLMGSDNLPHFTRWPKWQKLLKIMPFYIYPRAGFPFKPLYQNMHPLKHPLQIITNLSSTMVRKRLQSGLTINHLVPPKVAEYISKNRLYA